MLAIMSLQIIYCPLSLQFFRVDIDKVKSYITWKDDYRLKGSRDILILSTSLFIAKLLFGIAKYLIGSLLNVLSNKIRLKHLSFLILELAHYF